MSTKIPPKLIYLDGAQYILTAGADGIASPRSQVIAVGNERDEPDAAVCKEIVRRYNHFDDLRTFVGLIAGGACPSRESAQDLIRKIR